MATRVTSPDSKGQVCGFMVGNVLYSEREPETMFRKLAAIVKETSGDETSLSLTADIDSPEEMSAFETLRGRWEEHLRMQGSTPPAISIQTLDPKWDRWSM